MEAKCAEHRPMSPTLAPWGTSAGCSSEAPISPPCPLGANQPRGPTRH
jgi:hypothetical protein